MTFSWNNWQILLTCLVNTWFCDDAELAVLDGDVAGGPGCATLESVDRARDPGPGGARPGQRPSSSVWSGWAAGARPACPGQGRKYLWPAPVSPPCSQRPPGPPPALSHNTHREYWTIKSPDNSDVCFYEQLNTSTISDIADMNYKNYKTKKYLLVLF